MVEYILLLGVACTGPDTPVPYLRRRPRRNRAAGLIARDECLKRMPSQLDRSHGRTKAAVLVAAGGCNGRRRV
jgi:hypothetical protein